MSELAPPLHSGGGEEGAARAEEGGEPGGDFAEWGEPAYAAGAPLPATTGDKSVDQRRAKSRLEVGLLRNRLLL